MIYIGLDNGVSGSIGQISPNGIMYKKMPVIRQLNYTKTKKWIHRVDYSGLRFILESNLPEEMIVYLERPMVNPGRFQATMSAIRALEATLIILEDLKIPYQYIDSKEWQKVLLPAELKGEELKAASLDIGKRKFPQIDFKGFKDADGLLIAEYCRIKNNDKKGGK